MQITKVEITNIGVFKGTHTFDFGTGSSKNIIAISGHNGSGKSTVFNSIGLCFHGKNFIGSNISDLSITINIQ